MIKRPRRVCQLASGPLVTATVHPSSLLRAPDDETRQRETQRFIQDLRAIAKRL
jgi:uracil-DNA glycosylase